MHFQLNDSSEKILNAKKTGRRSILELEPTVTIKENHFFLLSVKEAKREDYCGIVPGDHEASAKLAVGENTIKAKRIFTTLIIWMDMKSRDPGPSSSWSAAKPSRTDLEESCRSVRSVYPLLRFTMTENMSEDTPFVALAENAHNKSPIRGMILESRGLVEKVSCNTDQDPGAVHRRSDESYLAEFTKLPAKCSLKKNLAVSKSKKIFTVQNCSPQGTIFRVTEASRTKEDRKILGVEDYRDDREKPFIFHKEKEPGFKSSPPSSKNVG
ncbi:hypothetical protein B9Z55_027316 [Caenorhabditis nigoni]|uniref:Uncharacterized protein n=1 Tax=Caenorhabditis nigoni TaxID=1611254 RepID=A0A2G5SG22_9PELO|nr:hypothetical protein B9Z55_027316 [Caenorhabditis nigoni]